jgi:maleylpyruvate isomerase
MTFHGYFRSSAAYRCRIAFNLKGVKPDFVSVHLRKGEQRDKDFLKLNPHGLVPALEEQGRLLTQSLAIIEWLDETHPQPALLPSDAYDRALVRSMALAIACDIHPLQNLRVLKHLKSTYGLEQEGLDLWCRRWIEPGLAALEQQVNGLGCSGTFLFGDTPSLADICLVPQMFSAARFGADVSALQTLNRVYAHCQTLPAFQDAHPSHQPDTEA